jgi:Hydroxymethylglutaryl-coenzyme A reductase
MATALAQRGRSAPEDTSLGVIAPRTVARRAAIRSPTPERGVYGSPAGFALTVTLDGKRCRVPAVADSAERLRPLALGLELVNQSGGFEGQLLRVARSEARLSIRGISNVREAGQRLEEHKAELLGIGLDSLPSDERHLDAAPALELGELLPHALRAYLYFDAGAPKSWSTLRQIVRAIAPRLRSLVGADVDCDVHDVVRHRVQIRCAVHARALAGGAATPDRPQLHASVERGLRRLEFASGAPPSAAMQNQAVLGAVSRVALALGHDPRRVVSDGQAHAARFGGCTPIVRFERRRSFVVGSLVLPLELEPHGRQRAPEAEAALKLTQPKDGRDLRLLAACVGLASQMPALAAAIEAAHTLTR